jgi:hypothetical protein
MFFGFLRMGCRSARGLRAKLKLSIFENDNNTIENQLCCLMKCHLWLTLFFYYTFLNNYHQTQIPTLLFYKHIILLLHTHRLDLW